MNAKTGERVEFVLLFYSYIEVGNYFYIYIYNTYRLKMNFDYDIFMCLFRCKIHLYK